MRLTGVDLNLLVAFDALMAERSVTRAAERLSIGQPAMSSTLGRLRKLFGDPLLLREGRTMVPTTLAETLVDPVREALGLLESTLRLRNSFDVARDQRTFTIIASDYVALVLLRPLLTRLAQQAPMVRIQVRQVELNSVDQLHRGQADLLIMPRQIVGHLGGLQNSPLFSDRYVCAVAASNDDIGESISLEEFSAAPYLTSSAGPFLSAVEGHLDALGVVRRTEISTRTFVLAPFLLPDTQLITMIHERLGQLMQREFGMRIRLVEPPVHLPTIEELMVWTPRHEDDAGHRWLRQQMHDLASEL